MKYLIGFEDKDALDPQMVGQKFYALAKAARGGFAVPRAVAISTAAHRFYLANRCWPEGLLADVINEAAALDLSRGLSIRSSAIREDLEKQSFAGQYRSFLQVVDRDDLKNSIEECWKSVASDIVRSYLKARNLPDQEEETPLMAVVVQKMVDARIAGIAFGRNPMKPNRREIVIEAVKGLAEDLVSGHSTPYRAVVDENGRVKVTPPPLEKHVADETDHFLYQENFWQGIARLIKELESYNAHKPLDIEWAVDRKEIIWLLQARRITTLDDRASQVPPGLWTRKIANDLWADRLTPFLAHHMVKNAPRFDFSRTLKILGIPVIRPTLTVIEGYLYLNGENIQKGMAYIPPKWRLPELDSLLPASVTSEQSPRQSRLTLFSVCLRSLLLPVMQPGVNPLLCLWLAKNDLKALKRQIDRVSAMPEDSPRLTMDKIRAALETLARLQVKNQWPYFFATFTTWVLRWLVINRLGLAHADFLDRLRKNANNISIQIEQSFRKMAEHISRDRDLAERFLQNSAARAAENLPPSTRVDLDNFLSRYGCRARHRTLFIKRWSESPQEVIGILQSLVRNQLNPTEEFHDRKMPMAKSGGFLPTGSTNEGRPSCPVGNWAASAVGDLPLTRLSVRLMTRLTRRFLDLREELRFTLDQVIDLIRQALLTLGKQTDLGDKIMFLNKDELQDIVMGKLSSREAMQGAACRYDEFIKPFEVATFYIDGLAENEYQTDSMLIRGIGTSPGRISGRAKIVDDPSRTDIRKGDILIAKNTDPGWTPILSIVGGMVMEEGGLLNHCSIVARELGVPSIVGVHRATQRIQDNDLITIDGGLGVIMIEQ
jgi:phosphohistidine swiveling domain-containing protein